MNTIRRIRRGRAVLLVALVFSAAFGATAIRAGGEEGCCGWKDCGVLPQPYEKCTGFGTPCGSGKDAVCCDTGGWCG
jgi:hypothetical protein